MKTKRTFLSILTLCIALLFTACSGKGTADTEKSQNTKTESGSESADASNSKLNDLYQQENQIFADHEDVWNKVFGMMSKSAGHQSLPPQVLPVCEYSRYPFHRCNTDNTVRPLVQTLSNIRLHVFPFLQYSCFLLFRSDRCNSHRLCFHAPAMYCPAIMTGRFH